MSAVQVIKRLSLSVAFLFATSLFPVATHAQTASCCIAFTGSCTALGVNSSSCPSGQAQVTCNAVRPSCPAGTRMDPTTGNAVPDAQGQCCTTVSSCIAKPATTACGTGTVQVACNTFSACPGGSATGAGGAAAGGSPAPYPAGPPSQAVSLPDPLGGMSIPQVAGGLIKTFTGIAGAIALLMFVYGGIMYILSGGDGEKVKGAVTILRNSAIGLVLIFGAYFFTAAIVSGILANPK